MSQTLSINLEHWLPSIKAHFAKFLLEDLEPILSSGRTPPHFSPGQRACFMNLVLWDYESRRMHEPILIDPAQLTEKEPLTSLLAESNRFLRDHFSLIGLMQQNRRVLADLEFSNLGQTLAPRDKRPTVRITAYTQLSPFDKLDDIALDFRTRFRPYITDIRLKESPIPWSGAFASLSQAELLEHGTVEFTGPLKAMRIAETVELILAGPDGDVHASVNVDLNDAQVRTDWESVAVGDIIEVQGTASRLTSGELFIQAEDLKSRWHYALIHGLRSAGFSEYQAPGHSKPSLIHDFRTHPVYRSLIRSYFNKVVLPFLTSDSPAFDSLIYVTVPVATQTRLAAVLGLYIEGYSSLSHVHRKCLREALHREGVSVFAQYHISVLESGWRKKAKDAALASLIGRNASHNIGSHILSSGALQEAYMWPLAGKALEYADRCGSTALTTAFTLTESQLGNWLMNRLELERRKLDTFMAQRLDFIAQIIGGGEPHAEPLAFYQDLLLPLLENHAYLSHLIKDTGFGDVAARRTGCWEKNEAGCAEKELRFVVHWPGKEGWTRFVATPPRPDSLYWAWQPVNIPEKPEAFGDYQPDPAQVDFLIGIAGGTTGCQAFYDIVENWLRNSAKYSGGTEDGHLELHLKIEEEDEGPGAGAYSVLIWDNLTREKGPGNALLEDLSKMLNPKDNPLVSDSTLELNGDGQGLLEIRECADILQGRAGWDARGSGETTAGDGQGDVTKPWPVAALHVDGNGAVLSAKSTEFSHIAYRFFLPKPRLLSVLGVACTADEGQLHAKDGLLYHPDPIQTKAELSAGLAEMAEHRPMLGLLVPPCNSPALSQEDVFQAIQPIETCLPSRLLVAVGSIEEAATWKSKWDLFALASQIGENSDCVHPRRLSFCTIDELGQRCPQLKEGPNALADAPNDDLTGSQGAVCGAYELWLEKRYGKPAGESAKWELRFYFDRSDGSPVWEKCLPCANSRNKLFASQVLYKKQRATNIEATRLLLFDNHGNNAKASIDSHSNCYIGSDEHLGLFNQLANPPGHLFMFCFFLLSAFEAAQTTVVVIDERTAEVLLDPPRGQQTPFPLRRRNEARCATVFKLKRNGEEAFLSTAIKTMAARLKTEGRGLPEGEGLWLSAPPDNAPALQAADLDSNRKMSIRPPWQSGIDAVVIHQGVIDQLREQKIWDNSCLETLKMLAPTVVITTGRGEAAVRRLAHSTKQRFVPFVSTQLIPEFSKYHLTRAILAACGRVAL